MQYAGGSHAVPAVTKPATTRVENMGFIPPRATRVGASGHSEARSLFPAVFHDVSPPGGRVVSDRNDPDSRWPRSFLYSAPPANPTGRACTHKSWSFFCAALAC